MIDFDVLGRMAYVAFHLNDVSDPPPAKRPIAWDDLDDDSRDRWIRAAEAVFTTSQRLPHGIQIGHGNTQHNVMWR